MNAPEFTPRQNTKPPTIPDAPYPGLRPFQQNEEILLFGRERQVKDVIDRLRESRFVAVIGGSGSGKSSLVLAGAVPELRAFGIPGAGDFWVPLVCTPGTNAAKDEHGQGSTPITRLARKFAALLKPPEQGTDAERLDNIADLLRSERGLAHLLRVYGDQLQTGEGPKPKDARILFVLDQFEEIFHPTTWGHKDAKQLIERVIDHFFSPDERCYVVLTMRSEHLNDCARVLELPDAINKSSYLVRRLDENQLRAAIKGPAERLLRLRQNRRHGQAGSDEPLPKAIRFDDAVVDRLLKDVKTLRDDPDHLPLLQHVLARTWQAARARVGDRLKFPDAITLEDLAHATTAQPGVPLPDRNVLTESLERWAEKTYEDLKLPDKARVDRLLPRLGLKDPNNGMYSQERIHVLEAVALLQAQGTQELAGLLHGFLHPIEYLFWDESDPEQERWTIKVSHESFIRTWPRLRMAIDDEAERFSVYAELLRKAYAWQDNDRDSDYLLESADLRQVKQDRLAETLAAPVTAERWHQRAVATHALAKLKINKKPRPDFKEYLAASRRQLLLQQAGLRLSIVAAVVSVVLLLLYFAFVQNPVLERSRLAMDAGARAISTPLPPSQEGVGSPATALRSVLSSVALLEEARTGEFHPIGSRVLESLSSVPIVDKQRDFLRRAIEANEPVVNDRLRSLLQKWIWKGDPKAEGEETGTARLIATSCWMPRPANDPVADQIISAALPDEPAELGLMAKETRGRLGLRPGQLLVFDPKPRPGAKPPKPGDRPSSRRAVFIPDYADRDDQVEVRAATLVHAAQMGEGESERATACVSTQSITSIQRNQRPLIAFDVSLRNLLFLPGTGGATDITLLQLDFEERADHHFAVDKRDQLVIRSEADARRFEEAVRAGQPDRNDVTRPALLPSWRLDEGSRQFAVGNDLWRYVDELAQRMDDADTKSFLQLQPASDSSACSKLALKLSVQRPGFVTRALQSPQQPRACFIVQHESAAAPDPAANSASQVSALTHFSAAVYPVPALDGKGEITELPVPIADMPRFSRSSAPGNKATWFVGADGSRFAGWLGVAATNRLNQMRLVAAPWSTCALWRLGRRIESQQPATARPANAPADAPAPVAAVCKDG